VISDAMAQSRHADPGTDSITRLGTRRPTVSAERSDISGSSQRNDLLRRARLRTPSPSDHTRPMSQRELAEAVTAYVFRKTERDVPLDRHYISRLERGRSRWPIADYRDAFRTVLGAATDAELGFYMKRRASDAQVVSGRLGYGQLPKRQPGWTKAGLQRKWR
jgi:hypothetical protein